MMTLSWMLLVDGYATLKFIDSIVHNNVKRFQIKNSQVAFVQQDLFLLENQLPYRILHDLIKNSKEGKKLRESVQRFIDEQSMREKLEETPPNKEPVHLMDLLRNKLLGCTSTSPKNNSNQEDWNSLHNVQELKAVRSHLKSNNDRCLRNIPSSRSGISMAEPLVYLQY